MTPKANGIISELPTFRDSESFYDLPDTRTRSKLGMWQSSAQKLAEIAKKARGAAGNFFAIGWVTPGLEPATWRVR